MWVTCVRESLGGVTGVGGDPNQVPTVGEFFMGNVVDFFSSQFGLLDFERNFYSKFSSSFLFCDRGLVHF